MKYLLIDGDILVYRAGFAVKDGPVSHALQAVKMMLNDMVRRNASGARELEQCQTQIYLSSNDKSNYRYDVAVTKPYKGNRKAPKPEHYDAIREYMTEHHGAFVVSDMEADDALSIGQMNLAFHPKLGGQLFPETCTIATIDKDLDQTPGWHYNFVKKKRYYVSKTQAYRIFCTAMLTGDSVDNIRGVEGVGPVKAAAAMKYCGRDKGKMIQHVYDIYTTKYNEDYFMEMGHLLWILRQEDKPWAPDLKTLRKNKSVMCLVSGAGSKAGSRRKLNSKQGQSSLKASRSSSNNQ